MTTRRMFFGVGAALAALTATGGLAGAASLAQGAAGPGPVEMQSEQTPRGRVLRRGSRGYYRRMWRNRRASRRYWRRRHWRRGYY